VTKAQAREYATRIRLGEPLLFWRNWGWHGTMGACFGDRTAIATWWSSKSYRLTRAQVSDSAHLEPLSYGNRNAVLNLLDERANAP
jgi:hypothetical protein